VAPRSKRSACIAYTDAACRRLFDCGLSAGDCSADYRELCPDWVFAEGSERTIDQMFECAETWSSYPCAELRTGARPCRLPGTRAPGESCFTPAQCDSQVCGSALKGATSSCASCARLAEDGEDCGSDGVACPYPEPVGLTDPARVGMGAECEHNAQCSEGLDCRMGEDVLRCLPRGEVGDPCATYLECEEPLGCLAADDDRLRCAVLPPAGQPCARGSVGGPQSFCEAGRARCVDGTCEALPSSGSPCLIEAGTPSHFCDIESSCLFDARDDLGECVPRAGAGAACRCRRFDDPEGASVECPNQEAQADPDCAPGLLCRCESCDSAVCKERRLEGESCSDPNTFCEQHTECKDGVCVGLESLGLFEQACMP
jgi:hypothetical protein